MVTLQTLKSDGENMGGVAKSANSLQERGQKWTCAHLISSKNFPRLPRQDERDKQTESAVHANAGK